MVASYRINRVGDKDSKGVGISNGVINMKFFGKGKEKIRGKEWEWDNFKSTKDYPVSKNMLEWVIGQDRALRECYLCLDEWTHKLKYLKNEKWFELWKDPDAYKPKVAKMIPAGPFLLLLGDAGTGKSLIGRALAQYLGKLYKKHDVKLYDVLTWKNKRLPSEPKISVHDAGEGRKIQIREKLKAAKKKLITKIGMNVLRTLTMGIGVFLLFIAFYFLWNMWLIWQQNAYISVGMTFDYVQNIYRDFIHYMASNSMVLVPFLVAGGSLIMTSVIVWFFGRWGGMGTTKGVGGAESTDAPKLIVDNSSDEAPFIDATGHGSSQLFGSIAWDPYQTGGLGTPEHQRVSAGDVHRANLGVLYIDEIKNLKPVEAVTLLTILEDGQLPIALRSLTHGGDTAAMSVSTEPVPALTFLVAAGNYDSIPQIHPALMDRIYGYGKVVSMNNDMPNTVENRRNYVQFIAQEIKRFRLLPFSRKACVEVITEARKRSGKRYSLTCKFRPMISIIKTASILAMNEGCEIVLREHVKEAIDEHCKTVQRQLLEQEMGDRKVFIEITPTSKVEFGRIHGLATRHFGDDRIGTVLRVNGVMEKKKTKKEKTRFHVTGIMKGGEVHWITDSICKVKTAIMQKYGVNLDNYNIHIDFAQQWGIEGPSAGVTMALLLASFLEKKPIRQDVAVTGDINIGVNNKIEITAVGGLDAKIRAAVMRGFKKVVIPMSNYKNSINPKDYKIKIIGASDFNEYVKEVLAKG